MKRAFTLTEVLVVICIAVSLAAISYPVFIQVRRSAQKSVCVSNLRQVGVGVALYRSEYGGSDVGTPSEMGLPTWSALNQVTYNLRCHGDSPDTGIPGYHFNWLGTTASVADIWSRYTNRFGTSAVLAYDPNHQPSAGPRSDQWENWTAIGLRLDGSVIIKTRRGYPHTLGWWNH